MRYKFKSHKLARLYWENMNSHHYPEAVIEAFFEVMATIDAAPDIRDLYALSGLHFEKLKGKRKEQYSMRLNAQFRLIVTIERDDQGKFLFIISIEDYHQVPARLITPGRILAREIDAREWTQKELAAIMGRPIQAINEIINGVKQITPDTALALADVFGTSAEFWLNLESNYRLNLARKEESTRDITRKSRLYSLLPITEIVKRGWISPVDTVDELEEAICRFLGVKTVEDTPAYAVNFRQASDRTPAYNAQIAWLARVRQLASQQQVGEFNSILLRNAIPELLAYSVCPPDVVQLAQRLASLGVHFVIVPHLPKTYLDGATFFLDEHPVIALSLRYDRIDSFWFTLAHELAHICAGHRGLCIDNLEQKDEETSTEEQLANKQAGEWLIPPALLANFIAAARPRYSYTAIEQFAKSIQRHPGIICGRLQQDGYIDYTRHKYAKRISPYLEMNS